MRRLFGFALVVAAVVQTTFQVVRCETNTSSAHDYSYEGGVTSTEDDYDAYGSAESSVGLGDQEGDYEMEYASDPPSLAGKENKKVKNSLPESEWFSCDNDKLRLSNDKICDGVRDCFDCSDESNCSMTMNNFFYCYGKDSSDAHRKFTAENPRCIMRNKFCDGETNCWNGADEAYQGYGLKCQVKGQLRSCLLQPDMLCDKHVDCEDASDVCDAKNTSAFLSSTNKNMFQCLGSPAVTIFQSQVCDDVIDCPDLSDECLCRHNSPSVNMFCASVCWNHIWANNSEGACRECEPGEFLQSDIEGKDAACVKVSEVCSQGVKNEDICRKHQYEGAVVSCISVDGTFRMVQARKCDGKPECFFGEDECVPECGESGGGAFCQLLKADQGYRCKNQSENANIFTMIPCNGEPECEDSSDENLCPKRLNCLLKDQIPGDHTHTYEISQQCDGKADCPNKADELADECALMRNRSCDEANDCSSKCPDLLEFSHTKEQFLRGNSSGDVGENTTLQYFVLVLSAFGVVGNFYGVILAVCNSLRALRVNGSSVTFLRESVVFTTIGVSRILVCSCFAFALLRQREYNCMEGLVWRASSWCSRIGATILVSTTAPVVALVVFAAVTTRKVFARSDRKGHMSKLSKIVTSIAILLLLWMSLALMAVIVTSAFQPHAWIETKNLPESLFGNVLDQMSAKTFSDRINDSLTGTIHHGAFTWSRFNAVVQTNAPSLGFSIIGVFGYYSSSDFCLPLFFVHPMMNDNPWNVFSIVVVSTVLAFLACATVCVVTLLHAGRNNISASTETNSSKKSLTRMCTLELLTWLPLIVMFYVQLAWPGTISTATFQIVVLVLFSVNYGIASVVLHAWTRRASFGKGDKMSLDSCGGDGESKRLSQISDESSEHPPPELIAPLNKVSNV